jgi:bacterial/archaeal transporter family-2 protein
MRLDLLAAIAGAMISVQARINGELSHRLNNGLQAALVSFGSGLLIISLITVFNPKLKIGLRNLREAVQQKKIARWKLFAGALGGSFVAIQTQTVPLVGVAIFTVASVAGQTVMSLLVDRIGYTGGGKRLITKRRVLAVVITIAAVAVSVIDRVDAKNLSFLTVIFGCTGGLLVGFQRALNGQINEHSKEGFTTSLLNFATGTILLVTVFIIGLATSRVEFTPLPFGPLWMYLGGVMGVIYISFAASIVQQLGVLTFTLFSIGGQLVSSLVIDIVAPTKGVSISHYLIIGIVMTYAGVIAGGVSGSQTKRPQSL